MLSNFMSECRREYTLLFLYIGVELNAEAPLE